MRSIICHIAILSVLFVGMESAADVVVDGYPHGDDTSHQQEFGHQLDAHEDGVSNSELDGDHCDHCCHAHSAGICLSISTLNQSFDSDEQIAIRPYGLSNSAQAPPTPPPTS